MVDPTQTKSMEILGVKPEFVAWLNYSGLRAATLGLLIDDTESVGLVYLSLVGYRVAVKGLWAAVLEKKLLEVRGTYFKRLDGPYAHHTVYLPEQGLDHLVMLHRQAVYTQMEPSQPFYLLNYNARPPYERFWGFLNKAVSAPMRPHWAAELWRAGMNKKLIKALPDPYGTFGWRVEADGETWLEIISEGLRRKRLLPDAPEEVL